MRDAGRQPGGGFRLRRLDELELSPLQFGMRFSDIGQGVAELLLGLAALGILGLERLGAAGHSLLQTFVRFAQRREQGGHHQKRAGGHQRIPQRNEPVAVGVARQEVSAEPNARTGQGEQDAH